MNCKKRDRILVLMVVCGECRLLARGSQAAAEIGNLDCLPAEVAVVTLLSVSCLRGNPRVIRESASVRQLVGLWPCW